MRGSQLLRWMGSLAALREMHRLGSTARGLSCQLSKVCSSDCRSGWSTRCSSRLCSPGLARLGNRVVGSQRSSRSRLRGRAQRSSIHYNRHSRRLGPAQHNSTRCSSRSCLLGRAQRSKSRCISHHLLGLTQRSSSSRYISHHCLGLAQRSSNHYSSHPRLLGWAQHSSTTSSTRRSLCMTSTEMQMLGTVLRTIWKKPSAWQVGRSSLCLNSYAGAVCSYGDSENDGERLRGAFCVSCSGLGEEFFFVGSMRDYGTCLARSCLGTPCSLKPATKQAQHPWLSLTSMQVI
jgi:hypothetical protein